MSPETESRRERIGLFGGTFDPIHIGHLAIAEDALREAHLDRVVFVPAWAAPLRPEETGAEPEARLALVRAAVAGHPAFAADDCEIRLARRVFSIETVRHFAATHPEADLFFLIGHDQFEQLDQPAGTAERLFRQAASGWTTKVIQLRSRMTLVVRFGTVARSGLPTRLPRRPTPLGYLSRQIA